VIESKLWAVDKHDENKGNGLLQRATMPALQALY